MPTYLLRYRVQTCLQKDRNISITREPHTVNLLFAERNAAREASVIAELEIEAQNNREAQMVAAGSVIPPVLDALSFSTGTPLLLEDCELVLKNEAGASERRMIYARRRNVPAPVDLSEEEIASAEKLLVTAEDHSLALCWHRYAHHRQLTVDQFVFQWLAFEVLAGDRDIETPCPNCGYPRRYRSSNKQKAFEMFRAADNGIEQATFNKEIWGRLRNAVFHGGKYPSPAFLSELGPVTKTLRRACEMAISRQLRMGASPNPHRPLEDTYNFYYFVSWQTNSPEQPYAEDGPLAALSKMAEEAELGRIYMRFPEPEGFDLLQYPADCLGW